jgi:sugar phosphate isomerase/epimerase
MDATRKCLEDSERYDLEICELVLEPPLIFENENIEKFRELCNSFNVKKQVHAPFVDLCLCSHNKLIAKSSLETNILATKISNEIEADIITIHPGLANFLIRTINEINYNVLIRNVKELLKKTEQLNLNICIENMPKNAGILLDEEDLVGFFSFFNDTQLYLTYDTSHFWTCDGNLPNLWKYLSNEIKNVHLVDNYDKNSDSHPKLGTGKIDFKLLFEILNTYNYNDALIVELSSFNDVPESIDFIYKFL